MPRVGNTESPLLLRGREVGAPMSLPSPHSEPTPPPPISWGCRNSCTRGVRRPGVGNAVDCAQGHGGTGHKTSLSIGCVRGGRQTGPRNAVTWPKRGRVGRVGRHVAQNSKKRCKLAVNFFNRLMSLPRPPVRIICSILDKSPG